MNIRHFAPALLSTSLFVTSMSAVAQTPGNSPDSPQQSPPEMRGQLRNRLQTHRLPDMEAQPGFQQRPFSTGQFTPQVPPRFAPWANGMYGPGMQHRFGMQGHGWGNGMMMPRQFHGMAGPANRNPLIADPALLDRVKTRLNLTSAQESVWNKYTKALQDNISAIKKTRESADPESVRKMNSAERFAFITKQRQQLQKPVDAIQAATDELNKALDDSQKLKAQRMLPSLEMLTSAAD